MAVDPNEPDAVDLGVAKAAYPKPRSSSTAYSSSNFQYGKQATTDSDESNEKPVEKGTKKDVGSQISSAFDGSGAVVELSEAVCVINQFPALAGATVSIEEGEIVLVRGPNGAGKSTLLRLCAGLAPLSGGTGKVLGHDLSDTKRRRALRRQSGLLAHETYLYDQLTVEENIQFWAHANRVDVSTVDPVLDRLDLGGRLRSVPVGALSAGQRRRASIALMISRRPRLWLLDEPHAGLDQVGRQLMDELVGHAIAFGATVLLASHDLDRATELATRTVTVVGGRIEEVDQHAP